MKIVIGKYSGFCNGVRYTVDQANKIINENEDVYCLGEIVHNEQVIGKLEGLGMKTIHDIEECPNNSKLIIRAHGDIKKVYDRAKEKEIELFDLTCGKIKSIRMKIDNQKNDHFIVIVGKKNHPESLGVQSFAGKYSYIIEDEENIKECIEIINKSKYKKVYVVSQTTFNSEKFDNIIKLLKENCNKEIIVDKTICHATSDRQNETEILSKQVDSMIIIGGKKSSNTKELEVISKKYCNQVYLIQGVEDIKHIKFKKDSTIGIMAGASTPEIIVKEIVDYLNNYS